jgi:uncharacterized protein with PIN domain
MSKYLLDNSVLIAYLKGRPGALSLIRPWIAAQEVATSQIVYAEAIEYIKGDVDYPVRQKELRVPMREITPYPAYLRDSGTICRSASCDAATLWFWFDRRHRHAHRGNRDGTWVDGGDAG